MPVAAERIDRQRANRQRHAEPFVRPHDERIAQLAVRCEDGDAGAFEGTDHIAVAPSNDSLCGISTEIDGRSRNHNALADALARAHTQVGSQRAADRGQRHIRCCQSSGVRRGNRNGDGRSPWQV